MSSPISFLSSMKARPGEGGGGQGQAGLWRQIMQDLTDPSLALASSLKAS